MVHFSVVDCKLRNNCAIKMTGRPRLETSNMRDVRETFDIKKRTEIESQMSRDVEGQPICNEGHLDLILCGKMMAFTQQPHTHTHHSNEAVDFVRPF